MNIKYCENNEITNFREIRAGNMKNGVVYRGSYPVFKIDKKRDEIYSQLVCEAGINCIINLSGNSEDLETAAGLAPWYNTILKKITP